MSIVRSNPFKFTRFQKRWFYTAFTLLFVTGALWALLHYFFQTEGEFGPAINPVEPWCLRIHGAAAIVATMILGSLLPLHIKRAWKAEKNRLSGLIFSAANVLLILSGYGLYYSGIELGRTISHWVHLVLGLGFPALLVWHIWLARREKSESVTTEEVERTFRRPHVTAAARRRPEQIGVE